MKFFRSEKGWGGISSPDAPGDVWVLFSVIDMPGYAVLHDGQDVEFRWVQQKQDSWDYVATWVRPLDL